MHDYKQDLLIGKPCLLTQSVVVDGLSPVSLFHHFSQGQDYAFLLESVTGGDKRGRYSVIAYAPDLIWQCKDGKASVTTRSGTEEINDKPLASLEALIAQHQMPLPDTLPPMLAGLIGMMGYEMVREVEDLPSDKEGPSGLPDGCFMRPQIMLVHDNSNDTLTLATPIWLDGGTPDDARAQKLVTDAQSRVSQALERLHSVPALPPVQLTDTSEPLDYATNLSQQEYMSVVDEAKEFIRAGEVFQIVPSLRFTTDFAHQPLAFYRALRQLNPSPYMFYLKLDNAMIIGASPEILVRVKEDTVTIRPIAGTRKRGANEAEDLALEQELLNDTKEMAEHLMLLDLGRNDVGRVAADGSVQVTERMIVERYSHVMHIVSNVTGTLARNISAMQALMAGFPAGTVTGAPKIRAMQLLDQLEPQRRGFYGGCVGYFSTQGEMDSCITLRTALIKEGKLHIQAGAGVVADSDPLSEYEEVCNKAKALMRAAELTPQFEVS